MARPDGLAVGGAPTERGWRDMLSNAFDVFTPSHQSSAGAGSGSNSSRVSINGGGGHGHNKAKSSAAASSSAGRHTMPRAVRPSVLLRAPSSLLAQQSADDAALALSVDTPPHSPTEAAGGRRGGNNGGGGGNGGGWLLNSSRNEQAGVEETRDSRQNRRALEDAFPRSSSAVSVSHAAASGSSHGQQQQQHGGGRRHVHAESFSPLAAVASVSPGELDALQNELAAHAALALSIASVAGAYTRGQLVPNIRDAAQLEHEDGIERVHPRRRSDSIAGMADLETERIEPPPAAESAAFGEITCSICTRHAAATVAAAAAAEGTTAPAAAVPANCAWADVLARSSTIPIAQLRAELRALSWDTPLPTAHRADVWLAHTIGVDPAVHAHWERYYAGLCASAAATVATSPSHASSRRGPASFPQSPSPPPSAAASNSSSSSSSAFGRSRAKFSAISFGEILKDVERTLPNFAFFADPRGLHVLQRLLTAFSLHRPIAGYCQSLNFVAALISLVFQNRPEHLAFAMLCHVLEARLSFYTKSMLGCVLDARVLNDLVSFYEPELTSVLARQDVSVEHFASSWLLCLFINAPLPIHHALQIWDLYLAQGETILFHTGMALFGIHKNAFINLYKPSAEQLMNIVLKIIGTTTSLPDLLARVRVSFFETPTLGASIASLRVFHRHALVREMSVLSVSKLRRLERSTGLHSPELQRLWECFLQGEDKWEVLVSGVCNSLTHFRTAFGAAVFPPHAATPTSASSSSSSQQRRPSGGGGGGNNNSSKEHESPRLWKGSGIVQASLAACSPAFMTPCKICVPPLPNSFHLQQDARQLHSCPRCTWLPNNNAPVPTLVAAAIAVNDDAAATAAAAAALPFTFPCTCSCSCTLRLSGLGCSVFGRLFNLFDSRHPGLHRSFLDFEDFVQGVSLFTHSNRAQRLRAVFTMAAGEPDDRAPTPGSSSSSSSASAAATTAAFSKSHSHIHHNDDTMLVVDDAESLSRVGGGGVAHVVRGRVTRQAFMDLVALFEEQYHGQSYIASATTTAPLPSSSPTNTPAATQGAIPAAWISTRPSMSTPSPTATFCSSRSSVASPSSAGSAGQPSVDRSRLLSSQASARLFVDMAFEKAAVDRMRQHAHQQQQQARQAARSGFTSPMPSPSPPSPLDEDSLSYEIFASCIVLHPLIAGFFRLDAIAD